MSYCRLTLNTVPDGESSDDPVIVAVAAEVREALMAYPHFCVVKFAGAADNKQVIKSLAHAVAGETAAGAGKNRRLSFTNVRIDSANAEAPRQTGTRYSRTNLPMAPHTDSSFNASPHELVAFQCVAHDTAGGDSILAPVEDVLAGLDEDTVALLREKVYPLGKSLRPIITGEAGDESIRYYRTQLDRPLLEGGVSLDARYQNALAALDKVLERTELFHRLLLRSGEILFMQNRKVMHGRDEFSGVSKRHFYRIRLRAPVLGEPQASL